MLLVLNTMYPHATWHTSFIDKQKASWTDTLEENGKNIKTTYIQDLPDSIKKSRILSLPFFTYAFESIDLSAYDIVISVTSSFAKGIITKPSTRHVCILLTPTRWLWGQQGAYLSENNSVNMVVSGARYIVSKKLREWDYIAAQRPDTILSISEAVAERCQRYYHRDSEVVYPPFDADYWKKLNTSSAQKLAHKKPYFLVVSRLEPYKRVELVVEAFVGLGDKSLIIIGKGSQKKRLHAAASDNITFLEDIHDADLAAYYHNAEALIMPQEEDFGYVALEAQSCGCPVIAYARGGAVETVSAEHGVFFIQQTAAAVREAVADFSRGTYNLEDKISCADFSRDQFIKKVRAVVGL